MAKQTKKVVQHTKNTIQNLMGKPSSKGLVFLIGIILVLIIFSMLGKPKDAESAEEMRSTLPGWSLGYRYWYDMDENEKSKLRLFGKYKQRSGNTIKFGWDKQIGRNLNDWNDDDDGVIFFEQEFKF